MAELARPEDLVLGTTDELPAYMRVETTILEPIVSTQNFVRFQLEPKGILSKDTCIQFRLNTSSAADNKMFLNTHVGISALIKTATLKIGGKVINNLQDVPFYSAMVKAYHSPAYRSGVDAHLHGITNTIAPNSAVTTEAGTFGLRDVVPVTPTEAALPYTMMLRHTGGPAYAIWLRELCPILNDIELPLFLLEKAGDIVIELQLNQQTSTANGGDVASNGLGTLAQAIASGGTRANFDTSLTLDLNSVRMYVDRHYFESDRMAATAERLNSTKGRMLNFTDVVTTTASIPQGPSSSAPAANTIKTTSYTNQVSVSGMRVKNLRWCYTVHDFSTMKQAGPTPLTPRYSRDFTGRYTMMATPKSDAWNIRVNDLLVYNTTVSNAAFKARELESVHGSPVALFTGLYSYDAMSKKEQNYGVKTHLFPATGSYSLAGGLELRHLEGSQHFAGSNLSTAYGDAADDSVLVGQKPIDVNHQFPVNEDTNFAYQVRYFAETVKRFAMRDGLVEVFT